MREYALKTELDCSLGRLTFSEAMKEQVRDRLVTEETAPVRERRPVLRRGLALALVCAALLAAALAAGPALWDLIRGHLGASAPYVTPAETAVTDQGIELRTVAALTDRNVTRLYFTLRDLTGERLEDGAELDLWPLRRDGAGFLIHDENAPNGGTPIEQVGYDSETGTLTLAKTFYSAAPQTALNLSVRTLVPGSRDFFLRLDADELAALAQGEPLESALDADGNRYLLPDQNPRAMDWEKCPLPAGEEPGVSVSSMGFAEDGRFHIRLRAAEGSTLTRVLLPDYLGRTMELSAELEDGADYAFPQGGPTGDDLASIFLFAVTGEYSTQGGTIAGVWDLEVPLEPVASVALSWPGGTLPGAHGQKVTVTGLWLSPLGLSLDCRGEGGSSFLWVDETPVVTLKDGTQAPVKPGDLVFGQAREEGDHLAETTERILWALETPTDLNNIASVTLFGETMAVPE